VTVKKERKECRNMAFMKTFLQLPLMFSSFVSGKCPEDI
jgi:hypothetical protein